jgi:hypothetical protein
MIDWTVFKIVNGAVLLYYTCASQLQEPLEVSGLKKEIVQISAGYHHSCAITGLWVVIAFLWSWMNVASK